MKKQILLVASILLLGFLIVSAQTPKTISGGIVNGKAQNLPTPEYPAAAKAVKAGGAVKVQVTIDENGSVTEASAVSGHPLLRQAAEEAARQARFAPTQLSGQAVKVTGVIVYNFTPSQTFILGERTPTQMSERTISDGAMTKKSPADSSEKTISGGVVNGKARNLVVPAYPAAAKAVGASGAVNVQVTIDENGNVTEASAVSGHPLLRSAAVDAARQAKFAPTQLSGYPVKVTGVIIYNFNSSEPPAESVGTAAAIGSDGVRIISAGIVNGKAKDLAIPAYPAAAKAVGAEGAVNVQVVIDENGDVVSASSVSGHPLLRQAAENAARESKFKPTFLNGQAVRVTGIIVYTFTAGDSATSKNSWFKTGFDLSNIQYNPSPTNLNISSIGKVFQPDWTAENQQLQTLSEIRQTENAGQTKRSQSFIDAAKSLVASLQSRLGNDELKYWQFNTGLSLSEALVKFRRNADEKQSVLNSLRQQIQSAPSNVSPEYLADLQKIATILEKQKQTDNDMQQIGLSMSRLLSNQ